MTKPKIEYVALGGTDAASDKEMPTWEDIETMDKKRKDLLALARDTAPIDTVSRLRLLPRTVFPRLFRHLLIWLVVVTFFGSTVTARVGWGVEPSVVSDILEGGGTFVAFMVIFYVGYCYQRYNSQFQEVQDISHSITNACIMARALSGLSEKTR